MEETTLWQGDFSREELAEMRSIQSVVFDPDSDLSDTELRIREFLSTSSVPREIIIVSMFYYLADTQIHKILQINQLLNNLIEANLINLAHLKKVTFMKTQIENILEIPKDTSLSSLISTELEEDGKTEIINAVLSDDPNLLLIGVKAHPPLATTLYQIQNLTMNGVVNLCIHFRAFRCIKSLLENGYNLNSWSQIIAVKTFSQDEYRKFFPPINKFDRILFDEAIRARQIWAVEQWRDFPQYWAAINRYNVFVDAQPTDPWTPWDLAPFVRPSLGLEFNSEDWEQWSLITDRLYDGEVVDIENNDMYFFILADIAEKRIKHFDAIIDKLYDRIHNFQYMKELMYSHPLVALFLFFRGVPLLDPKEFIVFGSDFLYFIDEDKLDLYGVNCIRATEGLVDKSIDGLIQWRHPGFVPSLGFCLYNDDLSKLLDRIGSFDIDMYWWKFEFGTPLDACAMYGSSRCFFYLLENGFSVSLATEINAIKGGNKSIEKMAFACRNESETEFLCNVAIGYRRMCEYEWLIENLGDSNERPFISIFAVPFISLPVILGKASFSINPYGRGIYPTPLRSKYFGLLDTLFREVGGLYFKEEKSSTELLLETLQQQILPTEKGNE